MSSLLQTRGRTLGDRLRAHHEDRGRFGILTSQPSDPSEGLQGFAQTHVVGQNTAEAIGAQVGQEVESFFLIRPQLRMDFDRHLRCHPGLQLGRSAFYFLVAGFR
jgi:hypothetical protein